MTNDEHDISLSVGTHDEINKQLKAQSIIEHAINENATLSDEDRELLSQTFQEALDEGFDPEDSGE